MSTIQQSFDIDVEHILEIAKAIHESNIPNKEEYFANRYSVFKTKYPQLYKKVCTETTFDMENLRFMLTMINSIKQKESSVYDAEVKIGGMLFNKYVKDNISNKKDKDVNASISSTCNNKSVSFSLND